MKLIAILFLLVVGSWIALEMRRLRNQLLEKDREIEALRRRGTEFVANVSHELKTPLTSIKGFAETLKLGAYRDPVKAIEFLDRIESNAERLSALVNDILDLAKIEQPNMYLEFESFDPNEVLEDIEKDFGLKLQQRKQALEVHCPLSSIKADRRLFDQALRNLVENAHRYCQEGARIQVFAETVREEGQNYAQFIVADNGPGISPEDLPRIFERFYRADKSRNRLFGGTGLGLAIVKHIMLSHGGLIRVASEPLKGARFTLLFPENPRAMS